MVRKAKAYGNDTTNMFSVSLSPPNSRSGANPESPIIGKHENTQHGLFTSLGSDYWRILFFFLMLYN